MNMRNRAGATVEEHPDELCRSWCVRAANVVQPHGTRKVLGPVRRTGFAAVWSKTVHRPRWIRNSRAMAASRDVRPMDVFTRKEWLIIRPCRTPEKVHRFLRSLPYNWERGGDTLRSFRQVIGRGTAQCLEAALLAAVILEQHGSPPLVVSFESKDGIDHVIYVFRRHGRWGSVARSRDAGLHGRRPVFRTIRELVWSYFDPYVDFTGRITGYQLVDLRALGL